MEYSISEIKEFKKRIKYNNEYISKNLKNNGDLLPFIGKVYTIDTNPDDRHFDLSGGNYNDILPSMLFGHLAFTTPTGYDGIQLIGNTIQYIEYKTVSINTNKYWKGINGGIYSGLQNNQYQRQSLFSSINARYRIINNLEFKRVKTILVIMDTGNIFNRHSIISAWSISGDKAHEKLSKNSNRDRTIKLSYFINNGIEITNQIHPIIETIGHSKWVNYIKNNALCFDEWELKYGKKKTKTSKC